MRGSRHDDPAHEAARRRDAGLARTGRLTRLVAAAAALATGAIAVLAAAGGHGRSGHTASAQTAETAPAQRPGPGGLFPAQSEAPVAQQQSVQPPQQAPAPSYAPPVVTSGGS